MISKLAKMGLEHPVLGAGMNAFWQSVRLLPFNHVIPGRFRSALALTDITGFLRVKEDGIYRGLQRFNVHPEVCRDLLQHGILQLRVKDQASFQEWFEFLKSKNPTDKITINMRIAPELIKTWDRRIEGESPCFNAGGTFPIQERLPIFSSPLFGVRLEEVKLPNGITTSWLTIDAPSAVEIVPITKSGKIILIKQPRHTAPDGWEVPAGILEKGKKPEEQALIELKEEAGLEARELTPINNYYIFVGSCNQVMRLFLARGLKNVGQKLEEHESISKVKAFSPKQVWKMIQQGKIRDSHTLVAVMLAMRFLETASKPEKP